MKLIFSVLLLSHFCNFQSGITEVRTYRIRDFLSRNLLQTFSETTIIALCLSYYRKLTMHFINAIIVVLQHPYFNNLFQNLGVTIWHKNWVQNVFRLVFILIRFPERIVLQCFFLKYPFTLYFLVFFAVDMYVEKFVLHIVFENFALICEPKFWKIRVNFV